MREESQFEIEEWQAVPIQEILTLTTNGLGDPYATSNRPSQKTASSSMWVVTNGIKPVDLYVYLKARFGMPNGLTMLAKNLNDSDNLIHWHYTLTCPSGLIEILCFTFRMEIWQPFSKDVSDIPSFLAAIKRDFARYGHQMGEVRKGLEKWQLFLNPYMRLKDMIETQLVELEALDLDKIEEPMQTYIAEGWENFRQKFSEAAMKFSTAAQICLTVRMLAPVWAESFVNLLLFALARPDVRNDSRLYESLLRQNIDIRIRSLHLNCIGFEMAVPYDEWEACKKFHTLMMGRNDMLHGNVDPRLTTFHELYFEGKTPLFIEFQNFAFFSYKAALLNATPEQAINDYQTIQDLSAHILICLSNTVREEMRSMMLKRHLGWDATRKRLGVLFPDHMVDSWFEFGETG